MPIRENNDRTLWIDINELSEVEAVQTKLVELGVPVTALIPDPTCDVIVNEGTWSDAYPEIVPRNGHEPGIIVDPSRIPDGHTLLPECEAGKPGAASDPGAIVHYAPWMSPPATFLMWFRLRSPELAEDFERLMAGDRDIVRGSLDTVSDWRLTRPADVPGQAIDQADYVLIAEIVEVERWEQQASEHVQRLADDLAHLVSSRGMLVVRPVL